MDERAWGLLLEQLKDLKAAVEHLAREVRTLHGDRSREVVELAGRVEVAERQVKAALARVDDLNEWKRAHERATGLDETGRPSVWVASIIMLSWHYPFRAAVLVVGFLALVTPESRTWLVAKLAAGFWRAVGM